MDSRELVGDSSQWAPVELDGCPFGRVVAASCPGQPPLRITSELHPEELQHAASLAPAALRQWVSGRLCLATAIARCGPERAPLLPGPNGRPSTPTGVIGSLSHKGAAAVAVAARVEPNSIQAVGVDVEFPTGSDLRLASRILVGPESERAQLLTGSALIGFVTLHYAVKEAVYKCAADDEQDELDFDDIEVIESPRGDPRGWCASRAIVRGATEIRVAVLQRGGWIVAVTARQ